MQSNASEYSDNIPDNCEPSFASRHIGVSLSEQQAMLEQLGLDTLDSLIDKVVPASIRLKQPLELPEPSDEFEILQELRTLASQNTLFTSYIGQGYYDCITPPVLQRHILENPGWYTQYTAYQSEISQGRLEALLNFQTMVSDLTGLEIVNASLLDEPTAAAEAITMCRRLHPVATANTVFVSEKCHPQTIEVIQTRCEPLGIDVLIGNHNHFTPDSTTFAVLVQYPDTEGELEDFQSLAEAIHSTKGFLIVATDLLSLTLLRSPGSFGADVAIGNTQRFGVPLGYGGPHAAFLATRDAFKRSMPGRVVGVSKDCTGKPALRLAMQTREQHIRRDKATSNICTAQVLLAIIAAMYAVYHGPEGLRRIAWRIRTLTYRLATSLKVAGVKVVHDNFFDTLTLHVGEQNAEAILEKARIAKINLRRMDTEHIGISLDETTDTIAPLLALFGAEEQTISVPDFPTALKRTDAYLTHSVFHSYRTETELMRYLKRLESRDLSLTTSMIPLGSCTMKLNAAAEMLPITWQEFAKLHPFVPKEQAVGYHELFRQLESQLSIITGFAATSLQPNAGSQGEYAGLLAIRGYHLSKGESHRDICLIPVSAHGTNPASAVMAGFRVVPVNCKADGDIDLDDLKSKAQQHRDHLAAVMVTYPSTHGVFEEGIEALCAIVHENGGQVYMDGANMNAQVGLCRPAEIGADVCHLNLHKTFCIPHGGGGPGVGPICVASHLVPFLPGHSQTTELNYQTGAVAGAPWGSAGILMIPWVYIRMMGEKGLRKATEIAILNANYVMRRLEKYYPVLFRGGHGFVAHECIIDLRPFKEQTGIEVEDVAKRLMDYGFHAPTMSWPVAGTLMIEPTESESKAELDRFCDAMILIYREIQAIADGHADRSDNVLKNAPHTAEEVTADEWRHPYTRKQAVFPAPWTREHKFWPSRKRVDNVYGDRNLICSCVPMDAYHE